MWRPPPPFFFFCYQSRPDLSRYGLHQTPDSVLWYLAPKCPAHPTDAPLDWDLGNLEAKPTPQTKWCLAGCIILQNEATANREYHFHEKGVQSARVLMEVVCVKVTTTGMGGTKVCPKHHTNSTGSPFSHSVFLVPCVAQVSELYTPGHPHDVKQNVIYRPGHLFPLLYDPILRITSPLLTLSTWPHGPAFAPHVHRWDLAFHASVTGSPLLVLWTMFDRYWPLQTRNTPK